MDASESIRLTGGIVAGAAFVLLAAALGRAESRLLRTRTTSDPQAPPPIRDVRAFPRLAVTTLWLGRDTALIGAAAAGLWLGGVAGAIAAALAAWISAMVGAARAVQSDGPLRGRTWNWVQRLLPVARLLRRASRFVARRLTSQPLDAFVAGDVEGAEGDPRELDPEERELLANVRSFGSRQVNDVLTPRVDVFWLSEDISPEDLLAAVDDARFARIPIHGKATDDVVGILYVKDLLGRRLDHDFRLAEILHPPTVVVPELPVDEAFHELRRKKVHIALVIDELGTMAGVITMEDLLEELFGEIRDESDGAEPGIERLGKALVVPGRLPVAELATALDRPIEAREDDTTVGGLLMETAGKIPRVADQLTIDGLRFTIERREGTILRRVRVEPAT